MSKFVVICKHTLFSHDKQEIYGTGSAIPGYLSDKQIDYFVIKHSLSNKSSVSMAIESNIDGKISNRIITGRVSNNLITKTLQEFFVTYKLISQLKRPIDIFIGVDPLNALYGIIIGKRIKINKLIFYTADYAVQRFANPMLNLTYHKIDRFASKKANQVWNVSSRITKLREKQGIEKKVNFFVPNTPQINKIKILDYKNINHHKLIIVSANKNFDLIPTFEAVSVLSKKYKDIRLEIIGMKKWEKDYKSIINKLNIRRFVHFIGIISHEKFLASLSKGALGLALYTNQHNWTYFSDSMKTRDFVACGLPVITTNVSSTADDIIKEKAGYVIDLNKKNQLITAIDSLFCNKRKYIQYRNNAIKFSKKYDINKILDRLFGNLLHK